MPPIQPIKPTTSASALKNQQASPSAPPVNIQNARGVPTYTPPMPDSGADPISLNDITQRWGRQNQGATSAQTSRRTTRKPAHTTRRQRQKNAEEEENAAKGLDIKPTTPYEEFVKKISARSNRVESEPPNNPDRPLYTTADAIQAGAALLAGGLQTTAAVAATRWDLNIKPTVNPEARSFVERVYDVVAGFTGRFFGSDSNSTTGADAPGGSNDTLADRAAHTEPPEDPTVPDREQAFPVMFDEAPQETTRPTSGVNPDALYEEVVKVLRSLNVEALEQAEHTPDSARHSGEHHHRHKHHRHHDHDQHGHQHHDERHHRQPRYTKPWDAENAFPDKVLQQNPEHSHVCVQSRGAGSGTRELFQDQDETSVKIENNCRYPVDVKLFVADGRQSKDAQMITIPSGADQSVQLERDLPWLYRATVKTDQPAGPIPTGYNLQCLRTVHNRNLDASYSKEEMLMFSRLTSYAYVRDPALLTGGWAPDPALGATLAARAEVGFDQDQGLLSDQVSGLVAVPIKRHIDGRTQYAIVFGGTTASLSSTGGVSERIWQPETHRQLGANVATWSGSIPKIYDQARKLVVVLAREAQENNASAYAIGHSLGGGLSSYGVGVARAMGYGVQARAFASTPSNSAMRDMIASHMAEGVKVENIVEGIKEVHVRGDVIPGSQNLQRDLNLLGEVFEIVPEGEPASARGAHADYRDYIDRHSQDKWLRQGSGNNKGGKKKAKKRT